MAPRRFNKEDLKASLHLIGKITHNELKTDKISDYLYIRATYAQTTIFIYERKPALIVRMSKYQINDVVELTGNFVANSYEGSRGTIAVVNEVKSVRKVGIFKNIKK